MNGEGKRESFSKERDGALLPETKRRDRYIAIEFSEPRRRRDVESAFRAAVATYPVPVRLQVIFLEKGRGLVRCGHREKDEVVRFLNGLTLGNPPVQVRTIGASGTIRAARTRYFSKP